MSPTRRRAGRAKLHGEVIAYEDIPAPGPVAVLIHGVGSSRDTWATVVPLLVQRGVHVLAVDLPGHGGSSKSHGDYSLGALASSVRDLLDHLGYQRCVLVGHSLGGGVAMQFAYQFPERCEGLVLVASGGLGQETNHLLRAASLPGAELVIPLISHPWTVDAISRVGTVLGAVGIGPGMLSPDSMTVLAGLHDPPTRAAFLATLRGVVDISGQRVSAISRLPDARLPILLVWGDRDPVIPVQHGHAAAAAIPDGRLVVFRGAGHEPHRYDPERFAELVADYLARLPGLDPASTA
ncbi:MAG TPA: alpha/beta fold hydrolase [Actinomycetes bacterium]|nr:alpha/beta fold hydrolase [Actinomycetes bacterium]